MVSGWQSSRYPLVWILWHGWHLGEFKKEHSIKWIWKNDYTHCTSTFFPALLTTSSDTSKGPLVLFSSPLFWLWIQPKAASWRPPAETCKILCVLSLLIMNAKYELRHSALQPQRKRSCNVLFWCCRFYLPHGITTDKENNYWVTDVALHQVSCCR